MRNNNLIAVVNEELMMVQKGVLTCPFEEEFNEYLEKIETAITNRITADQRFVTAIGEKNAKKTCFNVLPICFECEDCGELQYTMQVSMSVGNKETDFYYRYILVGNPCCEGLEYAPSVLYNNAGKSQLMQVFEYDCNGVTSVKTFKNGRGENNSDDYLERIYAEILADGDFKIF